MTDFQEIKTDDLEMRDAPALIWVWVADAYKLLWKDNPKQHDIGAVITSIVKYGFQELPKYDSNLGIKAGNGRVEALALMEKDGDYELPRGLAKHKESGQWAMPLIIGTDASSLALASAYAIDSNNLTMSGGDLTGVEQSFVWNENYIKVLNSIHKDGTLPVSVDEELLPILEKYYQHSLTPEGVIEDIGELSDEDFWPIIRIQVPHQTHQMFIDLMKAQSGKTEADKFASLLDRIAHQ